MKNSPMLEELLKRAKQIGNTQNPPLTAERFLVAVIDMLAETAADDAYQEMGLLRTQVNKAIPDPAKAREALMAYICREKGMVLLDDLYMKKRLQEATEQSEKGDYDNLNAVILFGSIRQTPSDAIKPLIETTGTNAPKTAAPAEGTGSSDDELINKLKAMQERQKRFADLKARMSAAKAADDDDEDEELDMEELFRSPADAKAELAGLVEDVKRIRRELRESVFGQDNAINTFATGYFQASMLSKIDKSRKRPRATFLFAGPPGVGKTFLAEKAAEALKLPFMRFDMSEYSDKEANLEFCGSDKVYKNAKAGNVTSFVNDNPKCVLLFDEIEKAHIGVIHLFLQMLDAGRLRDNYTDKEVSFCDAIIILTTNAGRQLYEGNESGDLSGVSRKVVMRALQTDINPQTGAPFFPGAICSRFASGNVVMFNHIGAHNLCAIARKEIRRHAGNLENETGIRILVDERVYTALLFSEGSSADARTIRSRAETFFNDELYELLRMIASNKTKAQIRNVEKIQINVELSGAQEQIAELFRPAEPPRVLLFASGATVERCRSLLPDMDVAGAQTVEDAVELLKGRSIDFALLDMHYGLAENTNGTLNIEDVDSPARDLFKFLRERRNELPIYLLEDPSAALSDEEKTTFTRQGVRGVLRASSRKGKFARQLSEIAESLHQQASMAQLSKENKLITFETAQSISKNGKNAHIHLFDFRMAVAVDSEDAKNVLSAVSKPNVRFDDVIGAKDAKKELTYFVEYLKDPKKYLGTGVKAPRGVLLYGPPGTGKTMLAKAMACEAGVTFLAAEGNQFLKKYVGEGSEEVHELFKTARKYAPSILFIDEIDAIAKERRGSENGFASGEETLTAFLTEMDGFNTDPTKPVFVLAATNFDVEPGGAKSLDPALMRRFDRRVYLDLPDKEDRIRFLKMKIANNPALAISEDRIDSIALRSTGMSLAELDSVMELALRSAIRDGSTKVTDAIFEEAFETFNNGEVKQWDVSQLERVARHEAGHALLCWLSGETPSYLTIVARGNHGGYMQHAEQEGKALFTKDELLAKIRTSLGGRAAEIVCYGQRDGISTGASGDLASATGMAQRIICAYGMDEDFGLAVTSAAGGAMSPEVRTAVNRILKEQMALAVALVEQNKEKLDALVEALMSKNHMTGPEIHRTLSTAAEHSVSRITESAET